MAKYSFFFSVFFFFGHFIWQENVRLVPSLRNCKLGYWQKQGEPGSNSKPLRWKRGRGDGRVWKLLSCISWYFPPSHSASRPFRLGAGCKRKVGGQTTFCMSDTIELATQHCGVDGRRSSFFCGSSVSLCYFSSNAPLLRIPDLPQMRYSLPRPWPSTNL